MSDGIIDAPRLTLTLMVALAALLTFTRMLTPYLAPMHTLALHTHPYALACAHAYS